MEGVNYVTDKAIESVRDALDKIFEYLNADDMDHAEKMIAWYRVRNFVDLVEYFKFENKING